MGEGRRRRLELLISHSAPHSSRRRRFSSLLSHLMPMIMTLVFATLSMFMPVIVSLFLSVIVRIVFAVFTVFVSMAVVVGVLLSVTVTVIVRIMFAVFTVFVSVVVGVLLSVIVSGVVVVGGANLVAVHVGVAVSGGRGFEVFDHVTEAGDVGSDNDALVHREGGEDLFHGGRDGGGRHCGVGGALGSVEGVGRVRLRCKDERAASLLHFASFCSPLLARRVGGPILRSGGDVDHIVRMIRVDVAST